MAELRATPYANPLTGLTNDAIQGLLAFMQDKRRTQQLQGLGNLLESTGIPKTVERAAYADSPRGLLDALTNVNRANVPLLKPETAEAAMTLAPIAAPVNRALMQATKGLPVGASVKNVGTKLRVKPPTDDVYEVMDATFEYAKLGGNKTLPIDQLTGGVKMTDPKEVKRVKDLAEKISSPDGYVSRIIVDDLGNVLEGQHRLEALRLLGEKNVPVAVIQDLSNKYDIPAMKKALEGKFRSDETRQLLKHSIDTLEEAGSIDKALSDFAMPARYQKPFEDAIKASKVKASYPQQEALDTAQRNAALPVEKGGLGLPKDNTPEMRAQAMGFETPTYHGTNEDIGVFNVEGKGKTSGAGAFLTSNPTAAETYVSSSGGGNILPLLLRKDDFLTANARGRNWADIFTNELNAKAGKKRYTPEELNLDKNSATSTDELGIIANELGLKGAEIKNVKDLGPNSHVMRAKEYLYERYGITPDETWSNVSGKQFDEAQKYMKNFYESQKGDIYAIQDPSLIRSRFAAFDPMRKNEADILAGLLPLGLLADEEKRKEIQSLLE